MADLSTKQRNRLPPSDFAIPPTKTQPGKYPDENRAHAANAEARAAQTHNPSIERRVDAAVHRKYPDMGKPGPGNAHPNHRPPK